MQRSFLALYSNGYQASDLLPGRRTQPLFTRVLSSESDSYGLVIVGDNRRRIYHTLLADINITTNGPRNSQGGSGFPFYDMVRGRLIKASIPGSPEFKEQMSDLVNSLAQVTP